MKLHLTIGDRDPWTLSWKPLGLIVVGLAILFFGGYRLIFGTPGQGWAALAAALIVLIIGGVAAIREKAAMDAAIEEAEHL